MVKNMNGNDNHAALIKQEQNILNAVISRMDKEILRIERNMTAAQLQALKAKDQCLPDAYGALVASNQEKQRALSELFEIHISRDELYNYRIEAHLIDDDGKEDDVNLKVGLHTYSSGSEIFVISWVRPVCRHYLLDNTSVEYRGKVEGKDGTEHDTTYHLGLKRKITIRFDKVRDVTHFYPLSADEDRIIADEFLQELLIRRTEDGFRNIVFSIQKKQGMIIQRPYNENLIVQGCAGSGKSMIMMHRLPILLFDNQQLDRNQIYIISPSDAYNKMIEEMMYQLEINDLRIGTLEQYYEFVLGKYSFDTKTYGKISRKILTRYQIRYFYSEDCVKNIRQLIEEMLHAGDVDLSPARECFGEAYSAADVRTPGEYITRQLLIIGGILRDNHTILGLYHTRLLDTLNELKDIHYMLANRRHMVEQGIRKQIDKTQEEFTKQQEELAKLDINKNRTAYENRQKTIQQMLQQYGALYEQLGMLTSDNDYFTKLADIDTYLVNTVRDICDIEKPIHNFNEREIYRLLGCREKLNQVFNELQVRVNNVEEKYASYAPGLQERIVKTRKTLNNLTNTHENYLSLEYRRTLKNAYDYYQTLSEHIIEDVYSRIAEKGEIRTLRNKYESLSCTPYLYTQILYQINGAPNSRKESLLAIDEAQNLTSIEMQLLKNVNDGKVVFNLFGDIHQHIEGSKGIDSWKEFNEVGTFSTYELNENYRNARQITDFCNQNLSMSMMAINIDGGGVHTIKDKAAAITGLRHLLVEGGHEGIKAIIVKNETEASTVMDTLSEIKGRVNDMTKEGVGINLSRWNLMTVNQSKGLEFSIVFAFSRAMSHNEKYICYTRALDSLYIVDDFVMTSQAVVRKVVTSLQDQENITSSGIVSSQKPKRIVVVKRRDTSSASDGNNTVREFFINAGFEVVDQRKSGGALWVIGDKQQLAPFVEKASQLFGISGGYSSGKATKYRPAWYTKTKK